MTHNTEPTLCVDSLPRKAAAVAYGNKLVIARFPLDETFKPSPFNSFIFEETQTIRAIAFLQIPDGPLCIVTAGDQKFIHVYNLSSSKKYNPDATFDSDEDEAEYKKKKASAGNKVWVPAFRFGPHQKRIVTLTTGNDGTIVFGDKFGEVYRLMLCWSPEHTIEIVGDKKDPLKPLLQHFSTLTTLFLSSPVPRLENISTSEDLGEQEPRRLFSADKDKHIRVSRYPETYLIEQYLWNKGTPAPMTCVTEIPFLYEEDAHVRTNTSNNKSGNKNNKNFNSNLSFYATGDAKGVVSFWAAYNDVPHRDPEEPFNLITTFHPHQRLAAKFNYLLQHDETARKVEEEKDKVEKAKEYGGVVSVVYIHLNQADHHELHPRDFVRGVLVAYELSDEIFFIPLMELGEFGLYPSVVDQKRLKLSAPPVALVKSNNNTAMTLLRDGSIRFVGLLQEVKTDKRDEDKKICEHLSNIDADVSEWKVRMPYFEDKIREITADPKATAGKKKGEATPTALATLDLFAHWKHEAVDPRTREREDDESDEEKEEKEESGKSNKKKAKKA
ncbi:hypothetical protein AGDE_08178 [Angomonas deanei]|nr:hypothetical protein AGDE_08178 [Angomonas deanei]|eukprot:EPY33649.1 hypothetical protein AGDE_08178 [Angomonas deanei]